MAKIDTISPLLGLTLPKAPRDPLHYGRSTINHYIFAEDGVSALVPTRSEKAIREVDANKALFHAVNLALNHYDDTDNTLLAPLDTLHGSDMTGRMHNLSVVKSDDRIALHNDFVRSPSRYNTIAAVFGESAVLLCRISEQKHEEFLDYVQHIPSHKGRRLTPARANPKK